MNLYDFQPWYPRGIRSFIAAGANHYVATFDETTVLEFPVAEEHGESAPDYDNLAKTLIATQTVTT